MFNGITLKAFRAEHRRCLTAIKNKFWDDARFYLCGLELINDLYDAQNLKAKKNRTDKIKKLRSAIKGKCMNEEEFRRFIESREELSRLLNTDLNTERN